ncbi:hypothetical protein CYMTET_7144 [Cymbomonas tetramitiformis]|uniref:Uncharacterized protein n=1 Tax=Cymbomonas tetramitiformis TaxID=36881 RepID=A0AAE0GW20_9CHLO|nr:hypothetical protein CYMTET_7144 [Cymbomonas tetramitiformis]
MWHSRGRELPSLSGEHLLPREPTPNGSGLRVEGMSDVQGMAEVRARTDFQRWAQEKQKQKTQDWGRVLGHGEFCRQLTAREEEDRHFLRQRAQEVAEEIAVENKHAFWWISVAKSTSRRSVLLALTVAGLALFLLYSMLGEQTLMMAGEDPYFRRRPEKRHNLFGQRVDAAAVEARLERQAQAGKEGQWNAEEHGEADTLVGMYQQDFYQHLKGGQVCNRYGKLCKWDVDGRLESVVPPGVSELAPRSATLIMLQHPVEVVMCSWVGVMDDRQAILISWWQVGAAAWSDPIVLWQENQHSVKSFTTVDRPVFLLQIDDDDDPGISIVYSESHPPAAPPPPLPGLYSFISLSSQPPPPPPQPPNYIPVPPPLAALMPPPPVPPIPRPPKFPPPLLPPPSPPGLPRLPHAPNAPIDMRVPLQPLTEVKAIRAKSFSLSNLVKDGPAGSAQAGQVPMVWGDARKYRSNDGLQIVSAPVDGREWWGNGSYLIPADVLTAQHHLPLPPYSVLRVVGPELKAEHEFILTRPNEGLARLRLKEGRSAEL